MSESGSRIRDLLGKTGVLPERPPQLAPQDIHMPQVATTILDFLGNPMTAQEGNRWRNPFSAETVLGNMNVKMHPKLDRVETLDIIEARLRQLATTGALEVVETEGHGNFYKVTNERRLELISNPPTKD